VQNLLRKTPMASVNDLGVVRSTTFVFKDLCTCIQKMEFSTSNTGTQSRCRPERRRAATSRAPACRLPSASAPEATAGRGSPLFQAARLPQVVTTPQDASIAPRHAPPRRRAVRALCTRRTASPSAVRPYARRPRSVVAQRYLGPRHPAITVGRSRDL
jgi:hypothetical protein